MSPEDDAAGDGPMRSDDSPQKWTLWYYLRRFVPGFIQRSFRAKFVVSFLIVVLLITAIGTATFFQIRDTIEEDASNQMRTGAQMRSNVVEQWISGMRSQTRMIATADVFATGDADRIRVYLSRSKARAALNVRAVHFVDADAERVVASTSAATNGTAVSTLDASWTSVLDELRNDSASVLVSPSSRRPNRSMVAFVSAADGGDGAVVVVGSLQQRLRQFSTSPSFSTAVVSSDGSVVFSSGTRRTKRANVSLPGSDFDGVRLDESGNVLRAYAPVDGTVWAVVTTAPKSEVYRVADAVGSNVTRIVVVTVLTLSFIAFVLGRQTVVPLVRLRRRTREMQDGNLEVDLTTDRNDEIGRLYEGFARMRDALRQQIRDAHQARRQAEQSKRELQRQNERLDQFASTLSHDLRNPLAVARGHVELLRTELTGDEMPGPETLQPHVEKVDDAHDRINSIIDDVLLLTREGEHVEETREVDIEDLASEAWTNVDNRDATLTVEGSHVIDADRSRLLRAFENLFRNAIDHVGDDVHVSVGLLDDGFYVADDGPGIPDEARDDVFEYGHTTSGDGTGLGLSIVKTIAEAHGWTVGVDDDYDGACFTFTDVFDDDPLVFEETEFAWGETASDFEWGESDERVQWSDGDDGFRWGERDDGFQWGESDD